MAEMVNKVCVCIKDYVSDNGRKYYEGNIYKVISVRNMYDIYEDMEMEYNELVSSNNLWLGYVCVNVFSLYFVYEEDVLSDINCEFNSIMDGRI